MATPGTDHLRSDSRGILDPGRMREHVDFVRVDPPEGLRGIVQWCWAVRWSLPAGEEFTQPVLSHPSANLSVGPRSSRGIDDDTVEATAVGVATSVDRRRLRGTGWNVAAKLEPGAFGAFLGSGAVHLDAAELDASELDAAVPDAAVLDASELTDRVVPIGEVIDVDGVRLARDMVEAPDIDARISVLTRTLQGVLDRADADRVQAARFTARLASQIEADRSLRTVAQLASVSGVGVRTLQRLFREHAGVPPLWMIRRYRLIDAADAARSGQPPSWSELAAALGYADQAHLARDFKASVGMTPTQYAASVRAID